MKPHNNNQKIIDPRASVRHVRIEHKRVELSTDDSQSWAVSYSDMLMVLMSFFVLFFSYDEKKRDSMISDIALDMKGKISQVADAPTSGHQDFSSPMITNVKASILSLPINAKLSEREESLTIQLSGGLYAPKQFDLTDNAKSEVTKILETLKPYNAKVRIVFIGHTDSSVFTNSKNKYLENNFDLSSLRASRAMSLAVETGFDPAFLAIEAAASNLRNSRTLSIKIEPIPVKVQALGH